MEKSNGENLGLKIRFSDINGQSVKNLVILFFEIFDIVLLSETWHTEISVNSLAHLSGYLYAFVYRKGNSGRILVYYRKELAER